MASTDAVPAGDRESLNRLSAVRRLACASSATKRHRWWPVSSVEDAGERPLLAVCLVCNRVETLARAMPAPVVRRGRRG